MNNCRIQVKYVDELNNEGNPTGWIMTIDKLNNGQWYEITESITEEKANKILKLINIGNN